MKSVRLACRAMATRFELVLHGDDAVRLRAAGEEAISEIKRLHDQLSIFRPNSAISRVNSEASAGAVRLKARLFELLSHIGRLSDVTDGAFDVTVGPLLEVWGFRDPVGDEEEDGGRDAPDEKDISEALERVGFARVVLDKGARTVTFDRAGVQIDLGGIGKGYALDVATDVLLSAGISCGLLHGGTSSVRAIGVDPSGDPWKVAVRRPFSSSVDGPLGIVALEDEAMAVSAGSGRFREADGGLVGHVIDPRTGHPVRVADLAIVVARNATDADALATGLLVLGAPGLERLVRHAPAAGEVGLVGFRGAVLADGTFVQKGGTVISE